MSGCNIQLLKMPICFKQKEYLNNHIKKCGKDKEKVVDDCLECGEKKIQ